MSYCEENALTLADLPSDIIREIIKIELKDSFESMRLISHRWNDVGIDYLRDRNRLPEIDWLTFCLGMDGESVFNFNLRVSNEYLQFLGLHNCNPVLHRRDLSKSHIAIDLVLGASMINKWFSNRTSLLFNRCSSIAKLDFSDFDLDKKNLKLNTIRRVFGDIEIQELSINVFYIHSALLERNIINIVRSLSVHRLELLYNQKIEAYQSNFGFFISLLPQAVDIVDSVDLTTSCDRPINWDEAVAREELTNYAADLSEKANVSVMFKMQNGNERIRFTLTARKHFE